ncbi:MAG: two-component system, NtrC family, nitrogen regulation sensor histidine kinase NtrY [Tenuifilum sp.]|jgi:signal transduction histidine kinase|uniref:sensor histidine kinase n=1 Tax=Tenuifilum sp. TaxID=2760880 RepID=UPI0024AAC1BF|nr:ATP-binding protein [Tenuifilum sp.]MDI3527162.1 two-component system, NtrC family, nitrogen regulation sensor histidine kinase NtrY [Tenuifilum sp.]
MKFKRRTIYPITTLAVAIFLLLISEIALKQFRYAHLIFIKKHKIEKLIDNRINNAKSHAASILKQIDSSCNAKTFELALNQIKSLPENEKLDLLIFKNRKICFWSTNNTIDLPSNFSEKAQLVKINSKYYFTLWQNTTDTSINACILIPVKTEFQYQNRYLVNEYEEPFKDLNGFHIEKSIESVCIPLRPKMTEPLYLIPDESKSVIGKNNLKIWLRYLSVFLFIISLYLGLSIAKLRPTHKTVIFTSSIILLRLLWLKTPFPGKIPGALFEPELYAHTWYNSSLGDFFINSLFVFLIVTYAFKLLGKLNAGRLDTFIPKIRAIAFAVITISLYSLAHAAVFSLANHSTIPLGTSNIFELNKYSLLGYVSISLLILSAIIANILWLRIHKNSHSNSAARFGYIAALVLTLLIIIIIDFNFISLLGITFAAIIPISLYLSYWKKGNSISIKTLLFWASIISIYLTLTINYYSKQKENAVRKVLAVNLSSERDPLAEVLLPKVYQNLLTDSYARACVKDISNKDVELYDYLKRNYFKDYLNRYDLAATVCLSNSLIPNEVGENINCNSFFQSLIDRYGIILPSSRFYFLSTQTGFITYIGIISYRFEDETRNLYIELNSRPNWEVLGYPELLIEGNSKKQQLNEYSWAKYHNGHLITKSGAYDYMLHIPLNEAGEGTYSQYDENGYNHIAYKPNKNDLVIISKPIPKALNSTASFAYILLFFLFLFAILLPLLGINTISLQSSLKNKIGWAMVITITLSMVLVAAATIHYNIKSFNERNKSALSEKLQSLQFELEYFIPLMTGETKDISLLNERLISLSNTFYSDINIYDTLGTLLATSRYEIFEKQLLGKRMNPTAWYQLYHKHKPRFITNESISKANYLSAYVPIISPQGNNIAYLNLPYFTKQEELRRELYNIVVAIINIFALLALLSISAVVAITSSLTKPLELIRASMSRVNITGNNATIKYSGNDEVGQLIAEYNRMVQELAQSAEELARSQRESAWREMAKQIAHEVKNPLTPIKLSLQYLVKAKKENLPNWDERFNAFAQSLSEQIDALTVIANEFSSFAKLPSAKPEPVNALSIIKDVINLHSGFNNVTINLKVEPNINPIINVDKDQIIRVFNNLIKNAIQSIERGKMGLIEVTMSYTQEQMVRIDIADNGIGIPKEAIPKIFTPNFTTKSGGTGLGLAISREIVINFGGRIYFQTEENKGTTFTVELPLYTQEDN